MKTYLIIIAPLLLSLSALAQTVDPTVTGGGNSTGGFTRSYEKKPSGLEIEKINNTFKVTTTQVRPIAFQGNIFIGMPSYWKKSSSCEVINGKTTAHFELRYLPLTCVGKEFCQVEMYLPAKMISKTIAINPATACNGASPDAIVFNGEKIFGTWFDQIISSFSPGTLIYPFSRNIKFQNFFWINFAWSIKF